MDANNLHGPMTQDGRSGLGLIRPKAWYKPEVGSSNMFLFLSLFKKKKKNLICFIINIVKQCFILGLEAVKAILESKKQWC